jgi:hypothetical protein
MGRNCAPLLADLFLHAYEVVFFQWLLKDTTDTQMSASYLDLHLEIDIRWKTNYDKRDDFTFPIVYSLFNSRNIPVSPTYGVYISQLVCYSRACVQ